jgi:hypothetical protein
MIRAIKAKLRRMKLISIIDMTAPADSKYSVISSQGVGYIKKSGYQLTYTEWRDLPIWVLEDYAKSCVLSSEGLQLKYIGGVI